MVKFIENELQNIRKESIQMWSLVFDQLKTVCESLPSNDKDRAWDVLIREKRVNASELKLDCDVEDFLVLYNPVAIDLRFVLAMYKINSDLERIGDFAENIARFVIKCEEAIDAELLKKLRYTEMVEQVLDMLETSREAMVSDDIKLANSIFAMDNVVDEINSNVTPILADYVKQHPDKTALALDLKSVFLRIERAGDHVTNLAEEIVFYIDAEVLKHRNSHSKNDEALMHKIKERGGIDVEGAES